MPATGCGTGSSICGTRLDRDRPTRQTTWPGEPAEPTGGEIEIRDRDADFVEFVRTRRSAPQTASRRTSTGELAG